MKKTAVIQLPEDIPSVGKGIIYNIDQLGKTLTIEYDDGEPELPEPPPLVDFMGVKPSVITTKNYARISARSYLKEYYSDAVEIYRKNFYLASVAWNEIATALNKLERK